MESPEERDERLDALQTILRRGLIVTVPCVVVSVITHALGVPWWIIALGIVFFAAVILFEV